MTNFKIGMKVVCVKAFEGRVKRGAKVPPHFKMPILGKKYTIRGFSLDGGLLLEEIINISSYNDDVGFVEYKFRPIQYDSNVNFEVIAKFQPIEERQDVPTQTPVEASELAKDTNN